MVTSRIPGFYKLSLADRRRAAAEVLGVPVRELDAVLGALDVRAGGLDSKTADKTIENVIGTYAMPFALALNLQMNGRDYLAPMVVEEPSVVAAASNAAKMVREGGGFLGPNAAINELETGDVNRARLAVVVAKHNKIGACLAVHGPS
jgi:hydroxymethylglutaryl-CoA reductase